MSQYIWFEDIKGPCVKAKHEGWIEMENWGWSCAREASGGNQVGLASGIAKFESLHFTASIGSATIEMFRRMLKGTHFKNVKIECTKSTGEGKPEVWMKVYMKHVLVMGVEQDVNMDDNSDTVNLSFSQVHVMIADQKADGTLDSEKEFKYDLTAATEDKF
jgi:type VI protein secretion system component Hcp